MGASGASMTADSIANDAGGFNRPRIGGGGP